MLLVLVSLTKTTLSLEDEVVQVDGGTWYDDDDKDEDEEDSYNEWDEDEEDEEDDEDERN